MVDLRNAYGTVRQPGDLRGPSWRSNVAEEARTRGFASLTLVRFAFIAMQIIRRQKFLSIRMNTHDRLDQVADSNVWAYKEFPQAALPT